MVSLELLSMYRSELIIVFKYTIEGLLFGNSIPTEVVPGIGAITLILCAAITRAKSSDKLVNLLTLTPSSGSISNNVIIGPGDIFLLLI